MEIERKFLVNSVPEDLGIYSCHHIEQGYLCTDPVVRIRRQDENYYLTYKSGGLMAREEYNLDLNKEAYEHLKLKVDGNIITKRRYCIPCGDSLMVELDLFEGAFEGVVLAEVEFPDIAQAKAFQPLSWFGEEVTWSSKYHNSTMSKADPENYL